MKVIFAITALLIITANTFGQVKDEVSKADSSAGPKFAITTKNDEAQEGKYKHLTLLNINYDRANNAYSLLIISDHSIATYLEIKDQDDNVIFFKQIKLAVGANNIALNTEDGIQTQFKLSFSDMKNDKPAVYVFRSAKDMVYSKK